MRRPSLWRLGSLFVVALLAIVVLPLTLAADDASVIARDLQLDVNINGQPSGLIARFVEDGDGRFSSPASELRELGIKVPAETPDADLVALDGVPGLSYVFDEAKQSMSLEIGDVGRVAKAYDARPAVEQLKTTVSDYGLVLNYDIFGSAGADDFGSALDSGSFTGVNTTFDARLVTPHGILSHTSIAGTTLADETDMLMLDTTYTFSDDDNMTNWSAGDFITGGTSWSRPVRIAGVQVRRNFAMRPDLVTTPMPAVSGSAAVPSTVDVFVNGVKSYSQQVGAGPYQIDNIPAVSGAGVAQVVTRDASGKETFQSLSFYSSPRLLRPGLYDFSAETGVARRDYGIRSMVYDDELVGMATLRAGITDWLTAEAHVEGGSGVWNAGGGVIARALDMGVVSAAASASTSEEGEGFQLYGSFETRIGPATLNLRSQHAFGDYEDLATKTTRTTAYGAGGTGIIFDKSSSLFSLAPPRAVDSATVSLPIAYDRSSISATYLRYQLEDEKPLELVTATYSRPLINNSSLFASGFVDLNDKDSAGFYLGVNIPLDDTISSSVGVSKSGKDTTGYVEASQTLSPEAGSWGWRVRDHEGSDARRAASLAHRMQAARIEAGVYQNRDGVRATGEIGGAVTILGGDIFTSNRINDAFAVVDAHAPGIKVQKENNTVGVTNDDGRILIPNLNAYHKNKISIDPLDLPIDAEAESTVTYVAPEFRSGVFVDFNVTKSKPGAIVILKDASGRFLPAGAEAHLEGSEETFVVGYEGQTYIQGVSAVNTLIVDNMGATCTVRFSYKADGNIQPTIGPEICQ